MLYNFRPFLLGSFVIALLSGCGASSISETSGSAAAPVVAAPPAPNLSKPGAVDFGSTSSSGSADSVVATGSVGGTVSASIGTSRAVSVNFASSDGLPITGCALSGTTLPPGWSGPSSFECASLGRGSGCVLNLSFAPTAAGGGTLTLNYVFTDNANMPRAPGGSVTIPYMASIDNNVIADISAAGQVTALTHSGSRSISIAFVTDDGNAATNLLVTSDLSSLPLGWTSSSGSFACAIVSTGNGCRLNLMFAPTAATSGSLNLGYRYTADSGTTKSGILSIPFAATSDDTVVATTTPAGEITATAKAGARTVLVAFTTDDGATATNLSVTSDLTALPAGWSAAGAGFSCKTVGSGSGCELPLRYAPTTLTSGTMSLNYAFSDSNAAARTGTVTLAYAATSNDMVVASASPSGQINAVVGQGSQDLEVTFTTDDNRDATNLQITSDLSALPPGWTTNAPGFGCFGLGREFTCQMTLNYAPVAAANGTLPVSYAYLNDSGEYKSGTLDIAYRATTHDNVRGTPTPTALNIASGTSATVAVVFSTDDGNAATSLVITGGLDSLPTGWSAAAGALSCATVSAGTPCSLSLTYSPLAAASGSLTLTFAYLDDSGAAKTSSVDIPFISY